MASAQVLFVRAREALVHRFRAQTMVEYALIIASIGVVVWGAYNVMGHSVATMASGIDSDLTTA